jgi:non-specific serine/threonine protein kinase
VEAAEAVCEEPLALDYLAQLREASLVLAEEGAGEMRFSMLETLREYGQEQLCAQEHAAAQQRHAQFFTALAARTQPEIVELVNVRANLERWDAELENLRAALRWCHASSSGEAGAELGLQLAEMVWHYRRMRGYWREGLTDLERSLARAPAGAPGSARMGFARGSPFRHASWGHAPPSGLGGAIERTSPVAPATGPGARRSKNRSVAALRARESTRRRWRSFAN